MPTILRILGLRFFFFSNEGSEPPHIHVEKDNSHAKYWLTPVEYADSYAFSAKELNQIRKLVEEHQQLFIDKWNEFLASKKTPVTANRVWFTDSKMYLLLNDGHELGVPLEWFPKLRNSTDQERMNWRLIGNGIGIHWEDLDEDLSVNALL